MTTDTLLTFTAMILAVAIIAITALRGWQGWLNLKTRELDLHRPEIEGGAGTGQIGMGARIEIADLKERIRKLEAIAAGVDL